MCPVALGYSDTMTEQTQAVPEVPIEFMGRTLYIRMPRPEQILVWQRTLNRLQSPDSQDWNGVQVLAALERTRKIIDSLLADPKDIEWLDDGMLSGQIGLKDTATIITRAVEKFAESAEGSGNREQRRAAKSPAKKAARKRAS